MATSTPYLNLVKPAYSETADIGVLNENADKIDQAVSGQAQAIAGKPDDATEMPLGPNDTTLVSQAITNLQNEIGIVCTGNTCAISASTGQYVVLKNSTISGRADGLYTAAKTIPANTVIDRTYLTPVSNGGLNDLKGQVDSLNSNLTDYVKFVDKDSGSVSIPSLSHQELYYTISDLANYDVIAVSPINLGDDRLTIRGWRVDSTNNRVYITISNPSASASNGASSFRIAMVRK